MSGIRRKNPVSLRYLTVGTGGRCGIKKMGLIVDFR
jgi:hypothetical protein